MTNGIPPSALLIGLLTGVLSGLMGVGGGFVAVPLMVGVLGLTQHKAHGTSLAMMVLTATAAALVYAARGDVRWDLALVLTPAMMLGAYLGARMMQRVPARQLRIGFGAFLVLVGLRLLVG